MRDITPVFSLIPLKDRLIFPEVEIGEVRGGWAFGATEQKKSGDILNRNLRFVPVGGSIQKAIDELNGLGGGTVILKSGTHLPTADITVASNIILTGDGVGNTIVDFNAGAFQVFFKGTQRTIGGTGVSITEGSTTVTGVGGTTFLTDVKAGDFLLLTTFTSGAYAEISSVTTNTTLILKNAWPYPTVTNLAVDIFLANNNSALKSLTITNSAKSVGNNGVLSIQRAVNFFAENVLITKSTKSEGIFADLIINSEFRNVESSYNGDNATSDGFALGVIKRVALYNCSALGNAGNGFDIGSANLSEGNALYSCFAEGNTGDGFDLNGTINLFSCRSMGNDGDGYELNGTFNVLNGCSAIDNGADGIEATDLGDDNIIRDCTLKDNDAFGIDILASAARNIITKCFFANNASGTIRDAGTLTHYQNIGTGAFVAANGNNNNIDLTELLFVRITGPTGSFAITGIAGGIGGKMVILYNTVAFDMTITNDATSTAANRILTSTGADVTLTGISVASFIYSATDSRWLLMGTQG